MTAHIKTSFIINVEIHVSHKYIKILYYNHDFVAIAEADTIYLYSLNHNIQKNKNKVYPIRIYSVFYMFFICYLSAS